MKSLLLDAIQIRQRRHDERILLLSINPDLKSDFGHYLNYEKRINEACRDISVFHHCLANREFNDSYAYISGVFDNDSGHYCLHRRSALNNEESITNELRCTILRWISDNVSSHSFDIIIVFMYMSSSKSAALLSCMDWPPKVRLVCNSFWDFLDYNPGYSDCNLSRLQLQSKVKLLALSSVYSTKIHDCYGLLFDYIPNPPPLAGDLDFFNYVRKLYAFKSVRQNPQITILMPSLMTEGKGRKFTSQFLAGVDKSFSNAVFVVRDRKNELRDDLHIDGNPRITLLAGDFSDKEIIELYGKADIAILPYSSKVFSFRTSGALVDCLMTSTVPVVFPNTWLGHICQEYDFGVIAESESLEDVTAAVVYTVEHYREQQARLLGGALKYMSHHSWAAFVDIIIGFRDKKSYCKDLSRQSSSCDLGVSVGDANEIWRSLGYAAPDHLSAYGPAQSGKSCTEDPMLRKSISANSFLEQRMLVARVCFMSRMNPAGIKGVLGNNSNLISALERSLDALPKDDKWKAIYLKLLDKGN